jgi:hypothetical protein
MKAMPYLFAISLVANFVLGLMLWQQHPAKTTLSPEPAIVQSTPSADSDDLPLPTTPMPLTASPFLPLVDEPESAFPRRAPSSQAETRASLTPVGEVDKPYAPPPPPNPHAYPPWQQRTPHRESQFHRALLTPEPR